MMTSGAPFLVANPSVIETENKKCRPRTGTAADYE
jgi:hypothetical protein